MYKILLLLLLLNGCGELPKNPNDPFYITNDDGQIEEIPDTSLNDPDRSIKLKIISLNKARKDKQKIVIIIGCLTMREQTISGCSDKVDITVTIYKGNMQVQHFRYIEMTYSESLQDGEYSLMAYSRYLDYTVTGSFSIKSSAATETYSTPTLSVGIQGNVWSSIPGWKPTENKVTIPPFKMMVYEVTNGTYNDCVVNGDCYEDSNWYFHKSATTYATTTINWQQATDYCSWVGGRLPTQAEWEYAAHGGLGKRFPWGDTIDCSKANYYAEPDFYSYDKNSTIGKCREKKTPVGKYPANGYGLYDMVGGVREWTSTLYDYPASDKNAIRFERHIFVGGAQGQTAPVLIIGYSSHHTNERKHTDIGFRCIKD